MRAIIKNVTTPSATPYYVDGILFIDYVFFYLNIRKDRRAFDESECSKGKEDTSDVTGWRGNQRTRSHYGSLTQPKYWFLLFL